MLDVVSRSVLDRVRRRSESRWVGRATLLLAVGIGRGVVLPWMSGGGGIVRRASWLRLECFVEKH